MATGIILPGTKLVKLPKSGAAWGGVTGNIDLQLDLKTKLDAKLNLAGGTLTGSLTVNTTSGECLLLQKTGTTFLRARDSGLFNGAVLESLGASHGGQLVLSGVSGGVYFGRRDASTPSAEAGFEAFIGNYNGSGVNIRGSGGYCFGADNGFNLHTIRNAGFFYGGATATIQMGANHATTPTAQAFKAHNVTTGTTAGASLEIAGGTGATGARGNVIIRGARVILAETLPTSASGLAAGTIWNDSGTLKVA